MDIEVLEGILSTYKISKPKLRGGEVENKSIPAMLTIFLNLIKDGIPSTQEEFISKFKSDYPDLKFRGVVSRLKRAYLSFIREYHLGFLLHKYFDDVVYDVKADILGVDYMIYYKGVKFNIHAFVDTEGGRYWRSIKNGRHNFKGEHIDLSINLSRGNRVGKFILYTDDHILKLKSVMDSKIDEKNQR